MRSGKKTTRPLTALAAVSGLVIPLFIGGNAPAVQAAVSDAATCRPTGGIESGYVVGGNNASVYAGGAFTWAEGAELEGTLVVEGNAHLRGSAGYDIGWVGAGSGVTPPAGSTIVRVGKDLINDAKKVRVQGLNDAQVQGPGHISVGGTITGADEIVEGTWEDRIGADAALGPFASWGAEQAVANAASRNLDREDNVEGTAVESWGTLTLTGAPNAERHYFEIDPSEFSKPTVVIQLEGIGETDPVTVEVVGENVTFGIDNVLLNGLPLDISSGRFGMLARQSLWVFPDATTIDLVGSGQFPGSLLAPTPGSTTYMKHPGFNGQMWSAGDIVQDRSGSEFHFFPFVGDDVMDACDPPGSVEESEVLPVAPVVNTAGCFPEDVIDIGDVTLDASTTDAIDYDVLVDAGTQGEYVITVTATPKPGYVFDAARFGPGWTGTAENAIWIETMTLESCLTPNLEAAPVPPHIDPAVCGALGDLIDPVVTAAVTEGVKYGATITTNADGYHSVALNATPEAGYVLGAADGWELHEDGSATWTVDLVAVDCAVPPVGDEEVALGAPVVEQAVCSADGEVVAPSVTLPADSSSVVYFKQGPEVAGGAVEVTASALEGYVFPVAAAGWDVSADGKAAVHIVELADAPECSPGRGGPVQPEGSAGSQDPSDQNRTTLPDMGLPGSSTLLAIVGAVLLLSGVLALGKRKRVEAPQGKF